MNSESNRNFISHFRIAYAAVLSLILAVVMLLPGAVSVYAATSMEENGINPNQKGSITVSINRDEWYVENTPFRLYKVADLNPDMTFSYTPDFSGFKGVNITVSAAGETNQTTTRNFTFEDVSAGDVMNIENSSLHAANWETISQALIQYVNDNNIQPEETENMVNRSCTFGKNDAGESTLSLGVYLIQGNDAKVETEDSVRTVTYQPEVIFTPQRMQTTDPWRYDISDAVVKWADPGHAVPKTTVTPGPTTTPTPIPASGGNYNPPGGRNPLTALTSFFGGRPQTGDTTAIGLYVTIIIIAAAALVIVLAVRRKKNK